jgi:hypothetical protein
MKISFGVTMLQNIEFNTIFPFKTCIVYPLIMIRHIPGLSYDAKKKKKNSALFDAI